MTQDELNDCWFQLGMRLRLSSAYHLERRRFFEAWNRLAQFLALVLGSGACVALIGSGTLVAAWLAFGVTALAAANLVIGFGRRSWEHARLHDQFVDLANTYRRAQCTEHAYADLMQTKADIDKCEPVPMPYLVTRCHINLMRADGYPREEWPTLNRWSWLFAHYLPDMDGLRKPHRGVH